MGVSENSVPLNPMVLLIIIPIKWLFHWEYTLFSDKPKWKSLGTPGYGRDWLEILELASHFRDHLFYNFPLPPGRRTPSDGMIHRTGFARNKGCPKSNCLWMEAVCSIAPVIYCMSFYIPWLSPHWCSNPDMCLSRVGPPYPSLVLASVWGHSAHRWPGVGRTARGPLCIVQRIPLGFWPTYWMLSRWQRDDALTCSLGSKYLSG